MGYTHDILWTFRTLIINHSRTLTLDTKQQRTQKPSEQRKIGLISNQMYISRILVRNANAKDVYAPCHCIASDTHNTDSAVTDNFRQYDGERVVNSRNIYPSIEHYLKAHRMSKRNGCDGARKKGFRFHIGTCIILHCIYGFREAKDVNKL